MSTAIAKLHQEHIGITKLLKVLDRQLATFHAGETPDYQIMSDVMHYMIHYPDMSHHPREDVIFKRLKAVDASLLPEIEELLKEHKDLIAKGRDFFETLQLAMDDTAMFSRATLEERADDYITLLRAHMDKEEGKVMPGAEKLLSAADWEAIEAEINEIEDPLFGSTVKEDYVQLFKHITEEAGL
jgi:hemerythrin-like domain-containing protein